MTTREAKLVKAIIQAAHERDGAQLNEAQLHADANLIASMTATEFDACLKICSHQRWLTGVTSRHNKNITLWNINDRGEAALTEL